MGSSGTFPLPQTNPEKGVERIVKEYQLGTPTVKNPEKGVESTSILSSAQFWLIKNPEKGVESLPSRSIPYNHFAIVRNPEKGVESLCCRAPQTPHKFSESRKGS